MKFTHVLLSVVVAIMGLSVSAGARLARAQVAAPAKMTAAEEAEAFKKARQTFRDQKYAQALIEMDKVYWNFGVNSNNALFHIILCQEALGQIPQMKANYQYLKMVKLNKKQRKKIKKLKKQYKDWRPPEPRSVFFSIAPYGGVISYSGNETKDSGRYFGVGGTVSTLKHVVSLGYESLGLAFNDDSSDYTQTQFSGSYWGYFGNLGIHAGTAAISVNDTYKAFSGNVITLGVKYFELYKWDIGIDYHSSAYGDYSTGELSVAQINGYFGKSFGSIEKGITHLRVVVDQISPNAKSNGFYYLEDLDNSHFSLGLNASFSKNFWTFAAGYWSGERIFMVDGGGSAITNNDNLYTSGYNLSIAKGFSRYSLTLSYGSQSYKSPDYSNLTTTTQITGNKVTSDIERDTSVIGIAGGVSF